MLHHFDIGLATKYGIDQAVLLSYIWQNIHRSTANRTQFYEGKYWSSDTREALQAQFPYFPENKVEAILLKLSENQLITFKNSTKKPGEIWYTLTEEALNYFTKGIPIPKKTTSRKPVNRETFTEIRDIDAYMKSEDRTYFIIAMKFWGLWSLENPNSYTLKNAEVSKWITALKLIIEKDRQDMKRIIGILVYFQKCAANEAGYDRFWFETIKSISAFRKQDKDGVYYLDRIIDRVNKKIEQSDQFYKDILTEENKILTPTN